MMKNWLPAELGSIARAMLITPRVCLMGLFTPFAELTLDVPARAAGAGAQRAAALDHKAGDDAVEGQAVIKALIDQFQKVFAGDRCCGSIQFNVNGFAVLHRNTNHRC